MRLRNFVIFAGSRACHAIFACRAGRRPACPAQPPWRGAGRPGAE